LFVVYASIGIKAKANYKSQLLEELMLVDLNTQMA
jgi:hypothetical protein